MGKKLKFLKTGCKRMGALEKLYSLSLTAKTKIYYRNRYSL